MRRHLCGVPQDKCGGASSTVNKGVRKTHSTPEEAFNCYAKHLTRDLGYTRLNSRDFAPPDGGPVRVLTKSSRFGAPLRAGKSGSETATGKRLTYKSRTTHNGCMIST